MDKRKFTLLALLNAAVLSEVVVAAFSQPSEQAQNPTETKPAQANPAAEVQLLVKVKGLKRSFEPLEPIRIQVSLKNLGRAGVTCGDTGMAQDFDFVVRDSHGALMPRTRFGTRSMANAVAASAVTSLGHNQARRYEIILNRYVDMSADGTYAIQFARPYFVEHQVVAAWSNIVRVQVAQADRDASRSERIIYP